MLQSPKPTAHLPHMQCADCKQQPDRAARLSEGVVWEWLHELTTACPESAALVPALGSSVGRPPEPTCHPITHHCRMTLRRRSVWRRSGARQTPRALGWLAWRQKRAGGQAARTCVVCDCSRMQGQPERIPHLLLLKGGAIRGLTEASPPHRTADDTKALRFGKQLPSSQVLVVFMGSEISCAVGRVAMGPGARPLPGAAHLLSSRSPRHWYGVNPRRWQPSTSCPQGSCRGQATSTRPPAEVLPALALSWGPWTWAPAGPSVRWVSLPLASWPGEQGKTTLHRIHSLPA